MKNDERVNIIARKMTKAGYLDAANGFVERLRDGEITDSRLTSLCNFWSNVRV